MGLGLVQQRANALTQTAVDAFTGIDDRVTEAFFIRSHGDAGGYAATGTGSAAAAVSFAGNGNHRFTFLNDF